jgi:hypothetical protein
MNATKQILSRRYYPVYHGRENTYRSYRSYYVGGNVRKGSADRIVGVCDAIVNDGWVTGVNGAYAARTSDALKTLPGFISIEK